MLSLSGGMSAGHAGGYFSREDYYLKGDVMESHSRWFGEGGEALGLEGPVREEDFRALCAGRHPVTGERLVAAKLTRDRETGRLVETHTAGNDATFSACKTVSLGYFLEVPGMKEAHHAAVTAVLEHVEERYTFYRSPEGLRRGKLVAAWFDHATSRNLDPQLHTHVFFLNMVEAQDGSWKAIWIKPVFQDQKSLGLLYRQELVLELGKRGYRIVITDRSQMFFELKGIDPELVTHFSSRREAIERQVELWGNEGKFVGVPHARLFEMAALETRDAKREVTREDVERIFERGLECCGFSREQVKRELEQSRLAPDKEPGYSAPEVVRLAAERLVEREAVIDRARLLDQAVLVSGGEHGVRELNLAIDGGTEGLVRLGEDTRGREFYTTAEMRKLEAGNLELIRELQPFASVTGVEEVRGYLKRVEEVEGVRLSAGQIAQIENELSGSCAVGATEGKAGTGKTLASETIERFNSEVLRPDGREHFSINIAFTGKAAQEMASASGRPAYTVDGFLNAYARGEVRLQREGSPLPRDTHAGEEILIPEGAQVVLRVDEVSFVGARQARHLLQIVKELQGEGVQAKLQLTGDLRQMQAIQSGDLFRQVLQLEGEGCADIAHLNEIRRQRDPEFLSIARTLNREDRLPGENAREALSALKERGAVFELEQREGLVAAVVQRYRAESLKPSLNPEQAAAGEKQSVLLISLTNDDRKMLNREIREARIAAGEIGEGRTFGVLVPAPQGITADSYRQGDQVLFSGYRGEDGRMQRWGARLNTTGTVTGIDLEKNRVAVTYSFRSKDKNGEEILKSVTKDFPAAEMAGKTTVYREEERKFATGDRIIALKNDKKLGLQNGSLGVITYLEASGRAEVRFGGREVALDLNRYRHLDHAYAVTIHKSQGATVDHAIWFAPLKEKGTAARTPEEPELSSKESFGRASYNALNVAVTRARYGASIFTNSLSDLAREVEQVDAKSSTLNPLQPGREESPVSLPGGRGAERKGIDDVVQPKRELPPGVVRDEPLQVVAQSKQLLPRRMPNFDGGASLGKRLDELARAGERARHLPDDVLRRLPATVAPVKVVPVAPVRLPGGGIDLELKK